MTTLMMTCGEAVASTPPVDNFKYTVDRFADIEILRYRVPDFESLSLKQKELIYFLSEAALAGRDILFDQNNAYNLCIRRTLETIYTHYQGDRNSEDFRELTIYLKRVWMGNGIHHHYSEDKFHPGFQAQFFETAIRSIDARLFADVLLPGETPEALIAKLTKVIFDDTLYPKRTNQAAGVDLILTSANNYYGKGVTQKEVEEYYQQLKNPTDPQPVQYGLNSKLVKIDGKLQERTYKVGGLYSEAISRIVYWLQQAAEVAENNAQKKVILSLIDFYQTGDLKTYDKYCIEWVEDLHSLIDFVNGFTETYGDPLGMKASWESIVNFKNTEATKRTEIISKNAQWFEDHSPIATEFKKEAVKGVSAKVITVAMLAGDCYPATPIGINLPNSNWIRHEHGSKSVTIENITEAYDKASQGNGFTEEFMWSEVERNRAKAYSSITNNLHTDLHECLGHGSGKLLPGVDPDALKSYGSTIEEARADLFGLYYMGDPMMLKLKLLPDEEAYKSEYYGFMMNGLMTQLTRIQPGKDIEEAHMRNRQLIASWVYAHAQASKAVELVQKEGKTYVVIHDYTQIRTLFGQLLAEIQRIKSTGDYEAGKKLVEEYAVKVNATLHSEVLARYKKLNLAPYRGFVNPVYTPLKDKDGHITDIRISYDENYIDQHLRYGRSYHTLPTFNE